MMKNLFILLFPALALNALTAQTTAKKYVLLEHFTNSNCSVCKSKNPAFYSLIGQAQYADDVHHIAYHPPVPYVACVFYQANKPENSGRSAIYGITGTPRLALNGELISANGPLLPEATLQSKLNQTSAVALQVTETGTGAERLVNIDIHTLGSVPAGDYKLYVALVEKVRNQTTPNGETVHHDVFRKMLPNLDGLVYTPAAVGQKVSFPLSYTINPAWTADQMYVVAFLQNPATKAVLNSGTKFDAVVSGTGEATRPETVRILPNPVSDRAFVQLDDDQAEQVEVYAGNGQRVSLTFSSEQNSVSIPTANLAPGIYFLKITGKKGVYTGKMVKE